ncbi:glutathione binding-like protein [Microvirga roseola]|uniref:glutathione binding-like protein n=1 Tax=Microvirga roseola TaxID=2883126 RepID=UPI00389941CE
MSNKSLGFEIPTERKGMVGYGSVEDVLNALEYAVSQSDYIAGDRFTAADVYVGSQIGWGMMFGTLEKRPAFEAYWQRIASRPAAIRHGRSTMP